MHVLTTVLKCVLTMVRVEMWCLCGQVLTVTHGAGMDRAGAGSLQLFHCRTWLNLPSWGGGTSGKPYLRKDETLLDREVWDKMWEKQTCRHQGLTRRNSDPVARAQTALQSVVETAVRQLVPSCRFWNTAAAALLQQGNTFSRHMQPENDCRSGYLAGELSCIIKVF